ncbi:MAG: protein translocase subunit SecD [Anaerolineae bacterium]|nr:MAG: protein translocase subunit SecD [Anaerolineae bacterium]
MKQRYYQLFILIVVLVIGATVITFTENKPILGREIRTHLGLDLEGGVQALLEADLPADTPVSAESMSTARVIVENRVNGLLGVGEATVQQAGERRILVELPGEQDPEAALATLKETGLLEFVDMGSTPLQPGTVIQTDFEQGGVISQTTTISQTDSVTATAQVWHTVMTGAALKNVQVTADQTGQPEVAFQLTDEGARIFADYTSQNVGKYLAIVLDKRIISVPRVNSPITQGSGVIQGQFTQQEANQLAVQLRYGSLPIPLKVVETRTVGPTLGQDSLRKSLIAGAIGLSIVVLFMALYYRVPGILADVALVTYALLSFALFKLIPVTLTLPGIAGFVLSIGMAVDANVLIFERLKEELREGKTLRQAIDLGWRRAWPSIRDSNFSTLITCAILFWFGSAFGASIVKGFAVTLALGVIVSMFTAIVATRTYLHIVLDNIKQSEKPEWFGI